MKTKKSLQKFTDLDKIKTVKQLKEYLIKHPKSNYDLWTNLAGRISKSYADQDGNDYELTEMILLVCRTDESKANIRNTTYEVNHSLITNFMHNFILEHNCMPRTTQIEASLKLSRQTIHKHLNDGIRSEHNSLVKGATEIMGLNALTQLYLIGVKDRNAGALKSFIQLSGATNNNTTNVNNYIQINNLKLTNEDFNKLPENDILEIETILSKTIKSKFD